MVHSSGLDSCQSAIIATEPNIHTNLHKVLSLRIEQRVRLANIRHVWTPKQRPQPTANQTNSSSRSHRWTQRRSKHHPARSCSKTALSRELIRPKPTARPSWLTWPGPHLAGHPNGNEAHLRSSTLSPVSSAFALTSPPIASPGPAAP